MALGDQLVEGGGDRLLVERRARYVEIEPAAPVADCAAGHRARHDRAQQVQTGVHAHQPMAPLPIDFHGHGVAGGGAIRVWGGDVDYLVGVVAFYRVDDRDCRATRQPQHAGIAGLSATSRVKHGAVEPNSALVDRDDPRQA
jgi:hypothetical protein